MNNISYYIIGQQLTQQKFHFSPIKIVYLLHLDVYQMRFPGSSVGKQSTCNAGDPGQIPGLGRSPGEGIGYPLQYSFASLVAQTVRNPPTMWETRVRFLGWEDPLEKEMAIHSSSCLENPMDGGA